MADPVCSSCFQECCAEPLTTDPLTDHHSYVCIPCFNSRQLCCGVCGSGWSNDESYNCDVCRVRFHVHCDWPTEQLVVIDENWGEAYSIWKCANCCS
jgi:hypothetical protein